MTKHHAKRFKVCLDEFHFSAQLREFNVTRPVDVGDASNFASEYKEVVVGLADGGLGLTGYFDGSASQIDAQLNTAIGNATDTLVLGAPAGFETVGNRVFCASAVQSTYDITGSIGDLVTVTANFQSDDKGIKSGENLHAGETTGFPGDETVTGSGTSVDNGAATTGGYAAYLSVVTNAHDGTQDFIVEHSTDDAAWATLATFTQVPAATLTSERVTGTGTVNRYIRADWTLAGTATAVAFVIVLARL